MKSAINSILLIMLIGIISQTAYSQSNNDVFHTLEFTIPVARSLEFNDTTCFPTKQANQMLLAKIENNELKIDLGIEKLKSVNNKITIAKLWTALEITAGIAVIEAFILIIK